MAGVKKLRRIQGGKETTAGTAVAATFLWRGMGTIEDMGVPTHDEEDVGYLSGIDRTHIPRLGAELQMEATPATYEQLPYILEGGVALSTAAADGTGSDYIYSYAFATNAAPTVRSYTLEGGDNQQAEEMEYSFVREFALEGEAGGPLNVSATWQGRQVTNTTFTSQPATPSVEDILFSKGKLYVDTTGGTIGTTQKTNTLLSASVKIATGYQAVFTADGNLYFTSVKNVGPDIVVTMVLEHDATSVALKTDMRAETTRQFRLGFTGSSVTTAGTTYSAKTFNFDWAGKVEKVAKIGEQNGNDVLEITSRARWNATAALFAEMVVVNELSSLT